MKPVRLRRVGPAERIQMLTVGGRVLRVATRDGDPGRPPPLLYGSHRQPHDMSQSVRHTDQPAQLDWAALIRQEEKGPSPSKRRICGASA